MRLTNEEWIIWQHTAVEQREKARYWEQTAAEQREKARYWEQKYNELKRKIRELGEENKGQNGRNVSNVQTAARRHFE